LKGGIRMGLKGVASSEVDSVVAALISSEHCAQSGTVAVLKSLLMHTLESDKGVRKVQ
jgi:hypothetical protein